MTPAVAEWAPSDCDRPEEAPEQQRLFALEGGGSATGGGAPAAAAPVSAPSDLPAPTTAPLRSVDAAPQRLLADVVAGAFATVMAGDVAVCPVCAGRMLPRWSAGAGAVGGRCADCGTTLD